MTNTPTPTDIGVIITNALARKLIYGTYVILLITAGAIQVGYSALQLGQPSWLIAGLAVLAYLGIPVGTLAAANTRRS
jgi:hypothetical protein